MKKSIFTSFFLAYHYATHIHHQLGIRLLMLFSLCATILTCASLTITLSIINGFHSTTHTTFSRVYGDYIIQAQEGSINLDKFITFAHSQLPPLRSILPMSHHQVLIGNNHIDDQPQGVLLKAIDPTKELAHGNLTQMITQHNYATSQEALTHLKDNAIFIGENLAHQYALKLDDTVFILYPTHSKLYSVEFARHEVRIAGIFKTGLDDLDTHTILSDFNLYQKIFPEEGIQAATLSLYKQEDRKRLYNYIKAHTDLHIYSWHDMYPAIISALALEHYSLLIILTIIVALASLLIITALCALIIYKQKDLGILYKLGMNIYAITSIFVIIGQVIAWIGSIIGIIIGAAISLLLKYYIPFPLPNVYFTTYVPIELNWRISFFVFTLTTGITLLASFLSYKVVKSFKA